MLRKLPVGQTSIKLKPGVRFFTAKESRVLDAAKKTVEFSFSSEFPVERWFGDEVLSHANGAYDFSRLNDGAPLLFNHDCNQLIGVVEKAYVADKRGHAQVRFGNNPMAQQCWQDFNDGILRNVSFAYEVKDYELTHSSKDGPDEYTGTNWEAFEISMVSVPADPTVGPGRNHAMEMERDIPIRRTTPPAPAATTEDRRTTMTPEEIAAAEAAKVKNAAEARAAETTLRADERSRANEILAMGDKLNVPKLVRKLLAEGKSVEDARIAVLEEIAKNPTGEQVRNAQVLDLTDKEKQGYSLLRALRAHVDKNWENAGFERECSLAIAKRAGRETNGFFMPMNIRLNPEQEKAARMMSRDLSGTNYAVGTAGSGTTGGTLVATQLLASEFIEVLRNKARVVQAGARMLSGLVGNVDIPRQTSQTTTYWIGEGVNPTESEAAFDKITLSPKNLGAYSQISRNMLLQSTPDIEVVVRDDLAKVLALAIDLAALSGSGNSGQPKGVLNTSGIGSVVGGTNGAAITIDHLIALESALTSANIDETAMSYMVNAKTVGALKTLKSTTGQYLWTNNPNSVGGRTGTPGEINGYPVNRTNQLTSTGTKGSASGVCSSLIFGSWDQLFIGEWGVLEILPNPYGAAYGSGGLEMRALQTVDVQVRHAAAFAAMTDALTS